MSVKINIAELRAGDQRFEIVTNAVELGLDKNLLKGSINVEIDVFKAPAQLDFNVHIQGILNLCCDRCLEDYDQPFNTDFELVYIQKSNGEVKSDDGYINLYTPFTRCIDITNDLREYILLAVPMRKVPKEINGKCSWCCKSNEMWNTDIIDIHRQN